jgi:hypothetical protein
MFRRHGHDIEIAIAFPKRLFAIGKHGLWRSGRFVFVAFSDRGLG